MSPFSFPRKNCQIFQKTLSVTERRYVKSYLCLILQFTDPVTICEVAVFWKKFRSVLRQLNRLHGVSALWLALSDGGSLSKTLLCEGLSKLEEFLPGRVCLIQIGTVQSRPSCSAGLKYSTCSIPGKISSLVTVSYFLSKHYLFSIDKEQLLYR